VNEISQALKGLEQHQETDESVTARRGVFRPDKLFGSRSVDPDQILGGDSTF
jgi:hypothetical protein